MTKRELAAEVAALRAEVAALRAELRAVKPVVIPGGVYPAYPYHPYTRPTITWASSVTTNPGGSFRVIEGEAS